jgi:hypothetical protein
MAKKKKPAPPTRPTPARSASPAVSTPAPQPERRPTPNATPEPVYNPQNPAQQPISHTGLIRFDQRVKIFTGLCIGLMLVLSLAKIHYSSIPLWNQIIPDGSDVKRGLISGQPHNIRLDEWGVLAPAFLSQANLDYPVENPGIGGDKTPLVMNLPVKHFIGLFRPDYWAYFVLGPEIGFAFWWNFKFFFTLLAVSLFFLLLTRNNFWLSVFGGFWVTFSSGLVWWSMFPAFLITVGCLTFVVFMELLYAQNRLRPVLLLIPLFLFAGMFAFNLYPAFQIPFAYMLIALIAGFIVKNGVKEIAPNLLIKLGALVAVAVLLGVSGYLYFTDAKSTLDVMAKTVYPGQRADAGGEGFVANWFSEFYSWFISDTKMPQTWANVSEQSHFITFAPIVFLGLVLIAIRTRRIDAVLLSLTVIIVAFWTFIEFGWPMALAKATLLSTSKSARIQLPLGFANVVLTVLYVNELRSLKLPAKLPFAIAGIVGVVALMVYAANLNVGDSAGFFKMNQLIGPTLFFIALGILLLPDIQFQYKTVAFGIALTLFLLPNMRVNPVGIGLAPITENILYKAIRDVQKQDPTAKWVIFGPQPLTFMGMATGINQLSGLKNQPDLKTMRVLDPTAKADSAYNRHARPVYYPYIDGRDSTIVQLGPAADIYTVGIDPCSPKLKKLGVKYFLFDHVPQAAETRCLKLVTSLGTLSIYQTQN